MANEMEDFLEEQQSLGEINPAITAQWLAKRLRKFTSSGINSLNIKGSRPMTDEELEARPKNERGTLLDKRTTVDTLFGDGALTYIYKKVAETLTLEANEIGGAAVRWGEENEPLGFKRLIEKTGKDIIYYGKQNPVFFDYDKYPDDAGGSPDGKDEIENAVYEMKCPYESKYHAEVLHQVLMNKFDLKSYDPTYYGQVQFNILLTGSSHGYFVSFDPRVLDYNMNIVIVRIEKDLAYLENIENRIAEAVKVKTLYLTQIGYLQEVSIAA